MHRVLRAFALLFAFGCRQAPRVATDSLVDDAGVAFSLPAPPTRIVSLIPATTELVFALDAGDRLVGRTSWCDYPAEAAAVPDLGNGIDPNIEAVVAAKPDLVLLYKSGANRAAAERFRSLGIPAIELVTDRMEDFDRITRLLGAALGKGAEAESLVVRTARDLEASRPPVLPSSRLASLEAEYAAATQDLAGALERARSRLAPETLASIEKSLDLIDAALEESRQALARDPGNEGLRLLVVAAWRQKVDLLRRATRGGTAL